MDRSMEDDDDLPPMLVDSAADAKVDDVGNALEGLSLVKVPITIVTGKLSRHCGIRLTPVQRISWCGKDHPAQLHPERAPREEDSRHSERLDATSGDGTR